MNTEDKFHPVNVLQRAMDRGDAFLKEDVLGLIEAFWELDGEYENEVHDLTRRIDDLEEKLAEAERDARIQFEERCKAERALNNPLKTSVGLST